MEPVPQYWRYEAPVLFVSVSIDVFCFLRLACTGRKARLCSSEKSLWLGVVAQTTFCRREIEIITQSEFTCNVCLLHEKCISTATLERTDSLWNLFSIQLTGEINLQVGNNSTQIPHATSTFSPDKLSLRGCHYFGSFIDVHAIIPSFFFTRRSSVLRPELLWK